VRGDAPNGRRQWRHGRRDCRRRRERASDRKDRCDLHADLAGIVHSLGSWHSLVLLTACWSLEVLKLPHAPTVHPSLCVDTTTSSFAKCSMHNSRTLPWQIHHHRYELPDDETRFTLELEFVQCLANADYLHWLALNRYLEDPAFLAFLRYLHYWRQPKYARFLVYPQALAMLELLGRAEVRRELGRGQYKEFLREQQLLHWRFYFNNRQRRLVVNPPNASKETLKAGGTWTTVLNERPVQAEPEAEQLKLGSGNGEGRDVTEVKLVEGGMQNTTT